MSKRASGLIFLVLTMAATGNATAACWKIIINNGNVINAMDVWHIQNKIVDHPQGRIIGIEHGNQVSIATGKIRSITFARAKKSWRHWLQSGTRSAKITLLDGTIREVEFRQGFQYRLKADDTESIALEEVDKVDRCQFQHSEAPKVDNSAPVAATNVTPRGPVTLQFQLKNGDILHGTVTSTVYWQTVYGKLTVPAKQIRAIRFKAGQKNSILRLGTGDSITGSLEGNELHVRLSIGQEIDIPVSNILSVSPASPQ